MERNTSQLYLWCDYTVFSIGKALVDFYDVYEENVVMNEWIESTQRKTYLIQCQQSLGKD